MESVKFYDAMKKEYQLTTEHPASSHNQPVLMDADNQAYGPADRIKTHAGDVMTADDFISSCLFLADPAQQDNDTIKRWNNLARLTK